METPAICYCNDTKWNFVRLSRYRIKNEIPTKIDYLNTVRDSNATAGLGKNLPGEQFMTGRPVRVDLARDDIVYEPARRIEIVPLQCFRHVLQPFKYFRKRCFMIENTLWNTASGSTDITLFWRARDTPGRWNISSYGYVCIRVHAMYIIRTYYNRRRTIHIINYITYIVY